MPRPKGWKPLTYTQIAETCGRIVLGDQGRKIADDLGVPFDTVRHLRGILLKMGAAAHQCSRPTLPPQLDEAIRDLIRTTRLTNVQIRDCLNLSCTQPARVRRKAYYDELRERGDLIPLCQCGDEFQHAHLCRFMRSCPRPVQETDRDGAIADLVAGDRLKEVRNRYGFGQRAAEALLKQLTRPQKKKRFRAVTLRREATKRRNQIRAKSAGLFARLDAGVSRKLPPEVRSETIQAMALEILDGQVTVEQALQRTRSFSARAYRQLGDPWRTVSIDAERDGLSFGDLIEDEAALGAFAELDEMLLA